MEHKASEGRQAVSCYGARVGLFAVWENKDDVTLCAKLGRWLAAPIENVVNCKCVLSMCLIITLWDLRVWWVDLCPPRSYILVLTTLCT